MFVHTILAAIIWLHCSSASSFTTTSDYQYFGSSITCAPNEDCNVTCDTLDGCTNSTITCPSNDHSCHISCDGTNINSSEPCSETTIISSSTNLTISCTGKRTCQYMEILAYNTENVFVHCSGNQSCSDMVLDNSNGNVLQITLTSDGPSALQDAHITAPSNGLNLKIESNSINGLTNTSIDVDGVIENVMISCNEQNSCSNAYFDFNEATNAFIYCNDNDACSESQFYGYNITESMSITLDDSKMDIYCPKDCEFVGDSGQFATIHTQYYISPGSFDCDDGNDANCFSNATIMCAIDGMLENECRIAINDGNNKHQERYICPYCITVGYQDKPSTTELKVIITFTTEMTVNGDYVNQTKNAFVVELYAFLSDELDVYYAELQDELYVFNDLQSHIDVQDKPDSFSQTKIEFKVKINTETLTKTFKTLIDDLSFHLAFENRVLDDFDDSYELTDLGLNEPKCNTDYTVINAITTVFYTFLGIVVLIGIVAIIQMYKYDLTIYVSGVFLFGFYSWDFYSDCLFAAEVYSASQYSEGKELQFYILFGASLFFLIIPIIGSVYSLFVSQDKWKKDIAIGDRVKGWNIDWSTYLLLLTAIGGSSFAAINLVNSRVFGHPLFCMGLSYRHIKKFENQRLWSVILAENVPQLVIQVLFIYWIDWNRQRCELNLHILVLAAVSSFLSIVFATVDIYNNKRLFGRYNNLDDYQCIIKVEVKSNEVSVNQWKLCLATHRFQNVFSQIIGVDKYAIEVDMPLNNPNGITIVFMCRTNDKEPKDIYASLETARLNGHMVKQIKEVWSLEKELTIGNISFHQIGSKKSEFTPAIAAQRQQSENTNPLNSDAHFIEAANAEPLNKEKPNAPRKGTLELQPYGSVDKVTKAKIQMMKNVKKERSNSAANLKERASIPENEEINDSDVESPAEKSKYSDVPNNVGDALDQLQKASQSSPNFAFQKKKKAPKKALPKPKTHHLNKKIQFVKQPSREGGSVTILAQSSSFEAANVNAKTKAAQFVERNVPSNQQEQFHTQMRNGNHAQSQILISQHNQASHNQPQANAHAQANQAQYYQNQNPHPQHHGHTMSMPYGNNNQNNANNMAHQQAQMHANMGAADPRQQFMNHVAHQHQMHANGTASAFNLNASHPNNNAFAAPNQYGGGGGGYNNGSNMNMNNNMNLQHAFQANPQMHYASTGQLNNNNNMNVNQNVVYGGQQNNEEVDHDHQGFVPPSPQQDMHKMNAWKDQRKQMDQIKKNEKKIRKQSGGDKTQPPPQQNWQEHVQKIQKHVNDPNANNYNQNTYNQQAYNNPNNPNDYSGNPWDPNNQNKPNGQGF